MPIHYADWRMEDFAAPVQQAVAAFLVRGGPWCLFLTGAVGTGKTSLAAAILRRWRALGNPTHGGAGYGEFVTASRYARLCRNLDQWPQVFLAWSRAPMLVLDDLAAARNTPHLVEQAVMLIGSRYDANRRLVATSNLSLEQLAETLDARVASRLQDGIVLDLGGHDLRQETGNG